MMMLYRFVWVLFAGTAFVLEAGASAGQNVMSSMVCMSFPVAVALTLLPPEAIIDFAQQRAGLKTDGGDKDAT